MSYCRRCEPLLLRPTPEIQMENLNKLFSQLAPAPEGFGWLWTGKTNAKGYGLITPVGGKEGGRHEWLAHRMMHGLLSPFGGHRVTEVIDHRDGIRLNTAIYNLEPVSAAENRRRRDRPPRGPLARMWSFGAAVFAEAYKLPVPDGFPVLQDWIGEPEPPAPEATSGDTATPPLAA